MREGPLGEGVPANRNQGLDIFQQSFWGGKMKIRNKQTGEVIEIDRKMGRVRHCQKRVHAWAKAVDPVFQEHKYRLVMVGLTYRPGEEWKPNDIRELVLRVRAELGEKLLGYAWVAELQERGAVHYHLLMLVKKGTRIPYFDQAGWWVHGSTHFSKEEVKKPFYICSYTSKKSYQKFGKFPKGLRMFAVWVAPGVISEAARWLFRCSALPGWLSARILPINKIFKVARAEGGGWLVDNFKFESPYQVFV